jgi:Zinc carboxypeptidase/Cytosolic carboxypeptidase N-terminal domain
MKRKYVVKVTAVVLIAATTAFSSLATAAERGEVTFSTAFEGGSLGRIEKLNETTFRVHVLGQQDERGRNRAATWYCFRMDHVRDRDLTITLTDFVGEYNDVPGSCPMNEKIRPAMSEDGRTWSHAHEMTWDNEKKEATVRLRPTRDSVWLATQAMYPHSRLVALVEELKHSPHARVEVIGKSVQGRDLFLITVTHFEKPDTDKKTVWLQARQHAWEGGTSYVAEGALRFAVSDTPAARALRASNVCIFTPMVAVDGCAIGLPRFNVHGYDPNRHWDEVNLRDKRYLAFMPEVWYFKKAILNHVARGGRIDLMLNMHNTETGEYVATQANDAVSLTKMNVMYDRLLAASSFDPSLPQKLRASEQASGTTNWLYQEARIPVMLMEQRIGFSTKLNRWPTVQDRLEFGAVLLMAMAAGAQASAEGVGD